MSSSEENSILLARIDERTKVLHDKITNLQVEVKSMKNTMTTELEKMDNKNAGIYITKDTFLPVQRAMFAAISTLVGAVIIAAINFVFRQ
jgi:hypothetical protein